MALEEVVLVISPSSGIGEGITREAAAAGAILMPGAHRTDRLDALAAELRQGERQSILRSK
jgi:NADP-dependent 3-hydroxy acid dehydrogenase YdfG